MRDFDPERLRAQRWAAVRAYSECEDELRRAGVIPGTGEWRNFRRVLEVVGALEIALVTSGFTIFAVFLIVNFIFHLAL